jgi:hypothetical protein
VAEDARAAARRIVEEVLAAHGQAATTEEPHAASAVAAPVGAEAPAVAGPDADPRETVDPRTDVVASTALPDALADRPSRAVARRIVEEVLAAHAAAEREVELPAPAAEADGPPPLPEAVPLQPVPGRDAVVPGVPASAVALELPTEPDAGTLADDAASIARRIVADVLADAETRAEAARATEPAEPDGPPAIPADDPEATRTLLATDATTEVDDPDATTALEVAAVPADASVVDDPDATQALEGTAAPAEDDAEATIALPTVDEPSLSPEPEPTAMDAPADDAEATIALPTVDEPSPSPEPADDPSPDDVSDVTAAGPPDLRPDADTTNPLATDRPATDAPPGAPSLDRWVDGGGEDEGAVATLPPRTDASAEVTTPVPVTEPPSRRTHWLLASILGAIGLAVLLPLAVAALRSLVELS